MACAISRIRPFVQQVILRRDGKLEQERRTVEHPFVNPGELKVQNLTQLFIAEGLENDDLVKAVHEFRGKLAPSGGDAGTWKYCSSASRREDLFRQAVDR